LLCLRSFAARFPFLITRSTALRRRIAIPARRSSDLRSHQRRATAEAGPVGAGGGGDRPAAGAPEGTRAPPPLVDPRPVAAPRPGDRKSTRLNSSHVKISYAVFCLKKKKGIMINAITL